MEVGECNFARACQLLRLDQVDLLKAPRGRGQELLATFDPPTRFLPGPEQQWAGKPPPGLAWCDGSAHQHSISDPGHSCSRYISKV